MAFVLDSPMAADVPVHVSGGHLFCFPASEDESMFLADAVAGYLEYLTADNGGLAGMREVDSFRTSDPAGPSFYPPAVAFLRDVVRGYAEQREYFVEYFSLQGRLVSLDGHQIVPSGLSADGFCGFPLGMRGVESDQG